MIEKPKSNAAATTSSGIQTTANVSQSQTTKNGWNTASTVKSSDPKVQLKLVIKNKNKIVSNREIKGSKDIVQQFNKFGCFSKDDKHGSLSKMMEKCMIKAQWHKLKAIILEHQEMEDHDPNKIIQLDCRGYRPNFEN